MYSSPGSSSLEPGDECCVTPMLTDRKVMLPLAVSQLNATLCRLAPSAVYGGYPVQVYQETITLFKLNSRGIWFLLIECWACYIRWWHYEWYLVVTEGTTLLVSFTGQWNERKLRNLLRLIVSALTLNPTLYSKTINTISLCHFVFCPQMYIHVHVYQCVYQYAICMPTVF